MHIEDILNEAVAGRADGASVAGGLQGVHTLPLAVESVRAREEKHVVGELHADLAHLWIVLLGVWFNQAEEASSVLSGLGE